MYDKKDCWYYMTISKPLISETINGVYSTRNVELTPGASEELRDIINVIKGSIDPEHIKWSSFEPRPLLGADGKYHLHIVNITQTDPNIPIDIADTSYDENALFKLQQLDNVKRAIEILRELKPPKTANVDPVTNATTIPSPSSGPAGNSGSKDFEALFGKLLELHRQTQEQLGQTQEQVGRLDARQTEFMDIIRHLLPSKENIAALQQQLRNKDLDLAHLHGNIRELGQNLLELQLERDGQLAQIGILEEKIGNNNESINNLTNELDNLMAKLGTLGQAHAATEKQNTALTNQITELRKEIEALTQKGNEENGALKIQLRGLQSQNAKIAELEALIKELRDKNNALQGKNSSLTNANETLKGQNEELLGKLVIAGETNKVLTRNGLAKATELRDQTDLNAKLQAQITERNDRITKLDSTIKGLQTDKSNTLEALRTENRDLTTEMNKLRQQLQNPRLPQYSPQLEASVKRLEEQLNTQQEVSAKKEEELLHAQEKIASLEKTNADLCYNMREGLNQEKDLEERIEELETQLEEHVAMAANFTEEHEEASSAQRDNSQNVLRIRMLHEKEMKELRAMFEERLKQKTDELESNKKDNQELSDEHTRNLLESAAFTEEVEDKLSFFAGELDKRNKIILEQRSEIELSQKNIKRRAEEIAKKIAEAGYDELSEDFKETVAEMKELYEVTLVKRTHEVEALKQKIINLQRTPRTSFKK